MPFKPFALNKDLSVLGSLKGTISKTGTVLSKKNMNQIQDGT